MNAHEERFNVWEVEVYLGEGGDLQEWDSDTHRKQTVVDKAAVYKRLMCNYFSVGLESRIGLGFDKHRTHSVFLNKVCYFCEGVKKLCCIQRTRKIRDIVDYCAEVTDNGEEKVIFSTDPKKSPVTLSKILPQLEISNVV